MRASIRLNNMDKQWIFIYANGIDKLSFLFWSFVWIKGLRNSSSNNAYPISSILRMRTKQLKRNQCLKNPTTEHVPSNGQPLLRWPAIIPMYHLKVSFLHKSHSMFDTLSLLAELQVVETNRALLNNASYANTSCVIFAWYSLTSHFFSSMMTIVPVTNSRITSERPIVLQDRCSSRLERCWCVRNELDLSFKSSFNVYCFSRSVFAWIRTVFVDEK